MMVISCAVFFFQIPQATSVTPASWPGQFSPSGQFVLAGEAANLKALIEFQKKKNRPLFTIIFNPKMVISRVKILIMQGQTGAA